MHTDIGIMEKHFSQEEPSQRWKCLLQQCFQPLFCFEGRGHPCHFGFAGVQQYSHWESLWRSKEATVNCARTSQQSTCYVLWWTHQVKWKLTHWQPMTFHNFEVCQMSMISSERIYLKGTKKGTQVFFAFSIWGLLCLCVVKPQLHSQEIF